MHPTDYPFEVRPLSEEEGGGYLERSRTCPVAWQMEKRLTLQFRKHWMLLHLGWKPHRSLAIRFRGQGERAAENLSCASLGACTHGYPFAPSKRE